MPFTCGTEQSSGRKKKKQRITELKLDEETGDCLLPWNLKMKKLKKKEETME